MECRINSHCALESVDIKMRILVFSLVCYYLFIQRLVAADLASILRTEDLFKEIGELTSTLLYKLEPGHCYTLITDPLYQNIFQPNFFKGVERSSYFIIRLPFYENTLSPETKLLKPLTEARKTDCQTYLIYLANGIQMERFLRFIDDRRAISAKAKLILLHDYRYFTPMHHYIWKRFVNVIFVRRYEASIHTMKNTTSTSELFELCTVPYPMPINGIFVTKHIDFWRNGRFRQGRKLIGDRTRNLEGQPMRIVSLRHTPAIFGRDIGNDTIYEGLEFEIIKEISKAMNFSTVIYESDDMDTEQWGRLTANGTYTGILGEMVNGLADIALADLYYTSYYLEHIDLTVPYNAECLTFLTPESLTDNSWQTLILPFSVELWGGVLFFLFCVGFIFYLFGSVSNWIQRTSHRSNELVMAPKPSVRLRKPKLQQNIIDDLLRLRNQIELVRKLPVRDRVRLKLRRQIVNVKPPVPQENDIFDSFGNCMLYTYSMLLVVSLPRLPRSWPVRLLTGCYWYYCLSIVVVYRASLTAILANPQPRVTIDTLDQLANSPVGCGAWGEKNKEFFLAANDISSQKVGTKMETVNDANFALERIAEGQFAYFENEYFLRELYQNYAADKNLHVMKQCAINMPISIGLEKNSPLKEHVDKLLRRIIEAGLVQKWLADSVQKIGMNQGEESQEALITLKKMYGALVALGVGFLIALLILLTEILYWRYWVLKKLKKSNKISIVSIVNNENKIYN